MKTSRLSTGVFRALLFGGLLAISGCGSTTLPSLSRGPEVVPPLPSVPVRMSFGWVYPEIPRIQVYSGARPLFIVAADPSVQSSTQIKWKWNGVGVATTGGVGIFQVPPDWLRAGDTALLSAGAGPEQIEQQWQIEVLPLSQWVKMSPADFQISLEVGVEQDFSALWNGNADERHSIQWTYSGAAHSLKNISLTDSVTQARLLPSQEDLGMGWIQAEAIRSDGSRAVQRWSLRIQTTQPVCSGSSCIFNDPLTQLENWDPALEPRAPVGNFRDMIVGRNSAVFLLHADRREIWGWNRGVDPVRLLGREVPPHRVRALAKLPEIFSPTATLESVRMQAVEETDSILLMDRDSGRVFLSSNQGTWVEKMNLEKEGCRRPAQMMVQGADSFWVTCSGANLVQRWSLAHTRLMDSVSGFVNPAGLSQDRDGGIYVQETCRIQRRDPQTLRWQSVLGPVGTVRCFPRGSGIPANESTHTVLLSAGEKDFAVWDVAVGDTVRRLLVWSEPEDHGLRAYLMKGEILPWGEQLLLPDQVLRILGSSQAALEGARPLAHLSSTVRPSRLKAVGNELWVREQEGLQWRRISAFSTSLAVHMGVGIPLNRLAITDGTPIAAAKWIQPQWVGRVFGSLVIEDSGRRQVFQLDDELRLHQVLGGDGQEGLSPDGLSPPQTTVGSLGGMVGMQSPQTSGQFVVFSDRSQGRVRAWSLGPEPTRGFGRVFNPGQVTTLLGNEISSRVQAPGHLSVSDEGLWIADEARRCVGLLRHDGGFEFRPELCVAEFVPMSLSWDGAHRLLWISSHESTQERVDVYNPADRVTEMWGYTIAPHTRRTIWVTGPQQNGLKLVVVNQQLCTSGDREVRCFSLADGSPQVEWPLDTPSLGVSPWSVEGDTGVIAGIIATEQRSRRISWVRTEN